MKKHSGKKKKNIYIISSYCWLHFFCSVRHPLYSLDTVSEEVRFVCVHNDYVKKVSPVFSHHVCHSFVSAHRKHVKKKKSIATEQFTLRMSQSGLCGSQIANTYTKPNGLLVMRKSFLLWPTSRFKTASVSSPLRMNLSVKKRRTECYLTCSSVQAGYGEWRELSYQDLPWSIYTWSLSDEPCQLLPGDYINVATTNVHFQKLHGISSNVVWVIPHSYELQSKEGRF